MKNAGGFFGGVFVFLVILVIVVGFLFRTSPEQTYIPTVEYPTYPTYTALPTYTVVPTVFIIPTMTPPASVEFSAPVNVEPVVQPPVIQVSPTLRMYYYDGVRMAKVCRVDFLYTYPSLSNVLVEQDNMIGVGEVVEVKVHTGYWALIRYWRGEYWIYAGILGEVGYDCVRTYGTY